MPGGRKVGGFWGTTWLSGVPWETKKRKVVAYKVNTRGVLKKLAASEVATSEYKTKSSNFLPPFPPPPLSPPAINSDQFKENVKYSLASS